MGTARLEVSGPDAARQAEELRATLSRHARPGDSVSPVEVQRSAEIVIAVIGLVFADIDTAKTIWGWWQSRHTEGTTVKILLSDGAQLDLSNADQMQLEITFQRATSQD